MKVHIPSLRFKVLAEVACAIAAMFSIPAFSAVNPSVQEFARNAAAEGIVLLKNDNQAPAGLPGLGKYFLPFSVRTGPVPAVWL